MEGPSRDHPFASFESNLGPFNYNFSQLVGSVSDFAFPMTSGVDVNVQRLVTDADGDVDFRYFGVATATATLGPAFSYESVAMALLTTASVSSLSSSLNSAEINLRSYASPTTTLLAGFRYIRFADQLADVSTTVTQGSGIVRAGFVGDSFDKLRAVNDMYGFQMGVERAWNPHRRLHLTTALKGVVFGDAVQTTYTDSSTRNLSGTKGRRRAGVRRFGRGHLSAH